MSLNRSEQLVFDYLQTQPEELRHWQGVVRDALKRREGDVHAAAFVLEHDLWTYYVERAGVTEPFRGVAARQGLARTSMRNLSELLLRLWAPPRPAATVKRNASGDFIT